jgi:glycosyltransferase involved in cell wall biosynthesis
MRILVCSTGFPPADAFGGMPFSTFHLSRALVQAGADVRVVTTDCNGASRLDVPVDRWTTYENIPVWYARNRGGPIMYAPSIAQVFSEWMPQVDCVINSGTLWSYLGFLAWRSAGRHRKPSLTYVRGLLDPWAFNFKPWRKRIYWHLVGKRILRDSTIVIALSESEKQALRHLKVANRIEVVPNGAALDVDAASSSRTLVDSQVPQLRGRRYVLFLGRVHPKKGVDLLIRAISEGSFDSTRVAFVIAGPVDAEYEPEWERLLATHPLHGAVITPGAVGGALKASLLRHAECFVLPSHSEGLPVAVLEALAAGCPVIITQQCNLPEVKAAAAGIVIDPDVRQLLTAMQDVLSDESKRGEMAANARALAQKFDWNAIAQQVLLLGREAAGQPAPGRMPPSC